MDEKRIAELRGLCERKTPGRWVNWNYTDIVAEIDTEDGLVEKKRVVRCEYSRDKEFVYAAITALPEALDEIELMKAKVVTLAEANKALDSDNYNKEMNLSHIMEQFAAEKKFGEQQALELLKRDIKIQGLYEQLAAEKWREEGAE